MNREWVLIDREALLAELQRAFDAQTAEVLLGVLDKVAAQARAAGVTREDFAELRQSLQALAEAQQRTEQTVRELGRRSGRQTRPSRNWRTHNGGHPSPSPS